MKYDQEASQKLAGTIKEPLQSSFKPGISVCMICRDNKDIIERAVKSFAFADEICIYDTGSVDGTQTVLARLRAFDPRIKWTPGIWDDDFSRARNCSIDMATHQWITFMDSDDVVPASECGKFLHFESAPLDTCYAFKVVNTSKGHPIGGEFSQLRAFPNHKDLRFRKRIHEQIIYAALDLGLKLEQFDITVQHHGYEKADSNTEKAMRNIRISMKEDEECFEYPAFVWSIANSFQVLGQFKDALEQYLIVWNMPNLATVNADLYPETAFNIAQMYDALGEPDKAVEWCDKCCEIAPNKLEPINLQAEILLRTGMENEAMKLFEKVLLTPTTVGLVANNATILRINALNRIGQYAEKHGKWLDAGRVWENMIQNFPFVVTGYDRAIAAYSQTYKQDKALEIERKKTKALENKILKFAV